MAFLHTLWAALQLLVMRLPRSPARDIGPGSFWLAVALTGAIWLLASWIETPAPRAVEWDTLKDLALQALLPLLLGYLAARVLRRPGIFWPLATLLLLFAVTIEYTVYHGLDALLGWWSPELADREEDLLAGIELGWLVLAGLRALAWLDPHGSRLRRASLAAGQATALALLWWMLDAGGFFYPAEWDGPWTEPEAAAPAFDAEAVLSVQAERVDDAVAALDPGRPGVPDLWVVAFGGDGSEDVFRNEVLYAELLFGARFGAHRRTLVLLNHPDTAEVRPLATRTNLRRAVAAIGARMERDEDILLLFVTTHGGQDHELLVDLDPLPLAQLRPDDLAGALRDASIHWRVVVVSACYSGGFVPALSASDALVLTAARADRTSFGCGVESDITWFGRAWLVDGLNATTSFTGAFERARAQIAEWERKDDKAPSEPQIATSPLIEAQLARWEGTLPPSPAVPFEPPSGEDDAEAATP